MEFICFKCERILKNPVECNHCHENFCEEHIKDFYDCPICKEPFSGSINTGLKNMIEKIQNERMNRRIKMDEGVIQCSLCSFEGKLDHFCFHLAQEHKKDLIEKFGKKKIYQLEIKPNNLAPEKIKLENYNSVDTIQDKVPQDKLNNQSENGQIRKLNSSKIVINNNFFEKPLSMSQATNLYYCNKKHQTINCDCCSPDHICREGNCLCVNCMNYNVKKYNLKPGELYNKAGRVAKQENGEYHCGKKVSLSIINSVGEKYNSQKQCSYYFKYFCKECEILNKYKDIYLDYISKNK